VKNYDPKPVAAHASMLIAATTAHLGLETVLADFSALRTAIESDNIITPPNAAPHTDQWVNWYAALSPPERRSIVDHALQLLD
jgi:hypothetical protein